MGLLLARQANDHMRCSLNSLKKVGLGDYIGQYHRLIGVIQGDARSLDYSSHAIGQMHRVEGCWICGDSNITLNEDAGSSEVHRDTLAFFGQPGLRSKIYALNLECYQSHSNPL